MITATNWRNRQALRYAASLDGVVTVLSGMSSLQKMKENHRILMEAFVPLTSEEVEMLHEVARIIGAKAPVGCIACGYCMAAKMEGKGGRMIACIVAPAKAHVCRSWQYRICLCRLGSSLMRVM